MFKLSEVWFIEWLWETDKIHLQDSIFCERLSNHCSLLRWDEHDSDCFSCFHALSCAYCDKRESRTALKCKGPPWHPSQCDIGDGAPSEVAVFCVRKLHCMPHAHCWCLFSNSQTSLSLARMEGFSGRLDGIGGDRVNSCGRWSHFRWNTSVWQIRKKKTLIPHCCWSVDWLRANHHVILWAVWLIKHISTAAGLLCHGHSMALRRAVVLWLHMVAFILVLMLEARAIGGLLTKTWLLKLNSNISFSVGQKLVHSQNVDGNASLRVL